MATVVGAHQSDEPEELVVVVVVFVALVVVLALLVLEDVVVWWLVVDVVFVVLLVVCLVLDVVFVDDAFLLLLLLVHVRIGSVATRSTSSPACCLESQLLSPSQFSGSTYMVGVITGSLVVVVVETVFVTEQPVVVEQVPYMYVSTNT